MAEKCDNLKADGLIMQWFNKASTTVTEPGRDVGTNGRYLHESGSVCVWVCMSASVGVWVCDAAEVHSGDVHSGYTTI